MNYAADIFAMYYKIRNGRNKRSDMSHLWRGANLRKKICFSMLKFSAWKNSRLNLPCKDWGGSECQELLAVFCPLTYCTRHNFYVFMGFFLLIYSAYSEDIYIYFFLFLFYFIGHIATSWLGHVPPIPDQGHFSFFFNTCRFESYNTFSHLVIRLFFLLPFFHDT